MADAIDAGKLFALTRSLYAEIADAQDQAEKAVADIRALIAQAARSAKAGDGTTLEQANGRMDAATAKLDEIKALRLQVLQSVVTNLGDTLQSLAASRDAVQLGQEGLVEFDDTLRGLTLRYQYVYLPIVFPPAGQEPDWDRIESDVEGPLFFFTPKMCLEWSAGPGVPTCKGPDYLHALSLVNQVGIALQDQVNMLQEFPVLGTVDMMAGPIRTMTAAAAAADDILKDVRRMLRAMLTVGVKTAEALAKVPGLLLVGGALAVYLLTKRKS